MRYSLILALCLAAVSAAGCCATDSTRNAAAPPVEYGIDLSSGGGFSGMHSGHSIAERGEVSRWQGMHGKKETVTPLGRISADELNAIAAAIRDRKIMEFKHHESGNMTSYLRITQGELSHSISWPGDGGDASGIPEQIRPVVEMIRQAIAALDGAR